MRIVSPNYLMVSSKNQPVNLILYDIALIAFIAVALVLFLDLFSTFSTGFRRQVLEKLNDIL